MLGMARRPFDPAERAGGRSPTGAGTSSTAAPWRRSSTGPTSPSTSPSRSSAAARRRGRSTCEGTRNVFEAAIKAGVAAARLRLLGRRLRLPSGQPAAADRGRAGPRQRELLLLAQKAELEDLLDELLPGSGVEAYVFRPCIVAGPRATMLIEQTVDAVRVGRPGAAAAPGRRKAAAGGTGPARPRHPAPARPPRRRRPGDGGGDLRRRPARRLQPRRRGRGPGPRHRPRARLALGPGPAPGGQPRHRRRPPPQLRLAQARVGDRGRHPGPDGHRQGPPRPRLETPARRARRRCEETGGRSPRDRRACCD